MQFKIWLSDNESVTIAVRLADADPNSEYSSPEVTSALISNNTLSDIQVNDLLDVVGQAIDHLTASPEPAKASTEDWREKFRKGTL